MKKPRTDTQRLDWIENRIDVEKRPFIACPDENVLKIKGYYVSSHEGSVRGCIDFLMDQENYVRGILIPKLRGIKALRVPKKVKSRRSKEVVWDYCKIHDDSSQTCCIAQRKCKSWLREE